MHDQVSLADFFKDIEADPRVNSRHVSLYVSLFHLLISMDSKKELELFSKEVMCLCKISSSSTYHKTIRELHEYGYIIYEPSFNHHQRSRICLTKFNNHKKSKAL
jgi:hypothetical protein